MNHKITGDLYLYRVSWYINMGFIILMTQKGVRNLLLLSTVVARRKAKRHGKM